MATCVNIFVQIMHIVYVSCVTPCKYFVTTSVPLNHSQNTQQLKMTNNQDNDDNVVANDKDKSQPKCEHKT